jgi:diadenosine tetraphosphate (Ap4A) HIT family hydrolase
MPGFERTPEPEHCSLCAELSGEGDPLHVRMIASAPPSRVLAETANFVVVPSLGPLATGHVMVVPRRHRLAVLAMPAAQVIECEGLVDRCVRRLKALYRSNVVVFEHGSARGAEGYSGACVEHAHLHVVPGPREFVARAQRDFAPWEAAMNLRDLDAPSSDEAYLLVGCDPGRFAYHLHRRPGPVPSQFLRQLYACLVGRSDAWDWRQFPGPDAFLRTMADWTSDLA